MKVIKAVYRLTVYDDGDLEMKLMPQHYIFDELPDSPIILSSGTTEKAIQIALVLKEIASLLQNESSIYSVSEYKKLVNIAIKNIAGRLMITEQTVADKLTRGLGINKQKLVDLIYDFFEVTIVELDDFRDSELYEVIIANLSKMQDLSYMEDTFIEIVNMMQKEKWGWSD